MYPPSVRAPSGPIIAGTSLCSNLAPELSSTESQNASNACIKIMAVPQASQRKAFFD
jgi:hypothetical protein